MLAIVARSASDMSGDAFAKELDELADHSFRRRICVTVSTTSVAVTPAEQLPGQFEADHFGHQHVDRLAEHDGFGLDAADAPADDAQAVDHGRVAVGADERVGQRDRADRIRRATKTHLASNSRLT